jgi:hypothetical protein
MSVIPGVAMGAMTHAQAIAQVFASGLVMPAIAAAVRAHPPLRAVVEQLAPFLHKAGASDADIAAALEGSSNGGSSASSAPPPPPPPPRGPVHPNVACDGCGEAPIAGPRFKCAFCSNYDLCEACHGRHSSPGAGATVHEPSHPFVKFEAPGQPGVRVAPTVATPTHESVTCDTCGVSPITGVRWKCAVCEVRPHFRACDRVSWLATCSFLSRIN